MNHRKKKMKNESVNNENLNMRLKNQGYFIAEYQLKEIEILNYCIPHMDHMWAATVASIILGCDFRDAKAALQKRIKES